MIFSMSAAISGFGFPSRMIIAIAVILANSLMLNFTVLSIELLPCVYDDHGFTKDFLRGRYDLG